MEKITFRPMMTIPKDKHDFLLSSAYEMGLPFNQFVTLCLVAGIRTFEKASQAESMFTAAELGGFLKALGVPAKLVKGMQADVSGQGVEKPKAKSRAKAK
jgi:hypothetical protein